jgi:peroxiredoxin
MITARCIRILLPILMTARAAAGAAPPQPAPRAPSPASSSAPAATAPQSSDVPEGVVEASLPDYQLKLHGLDGWHQVTAQNGKVRLPRGRYILMTWTVDRRERRGHTWQATFAPTQYRWFQVAAEPVRLDLTADLTAITTAEAHGTSAAMTLRFESGDWHLQSLTVDGARPPGLTLRIVDEKKKSVARVLCQYACCFTSRATWPTPLDRRGSFQVIPEAHLGPFPIKTLRMATLTLTDATAAMAQMPKAQVGKEAPDFSLPRIGGSTNLRLFWSRGKPFLLLFSCGCAPCQEMAKRLVEAPEIAKQAEMAVVVTNQPAATVEGASQFREACGYKGPMLADDGRVGLAFDALRCPKLWVLDAAGVARWTGGGGGDSRTPAALVSEALHQLAALAPGAAPANAAR